MSWNETTEAETFDLDAAVAEYVERTQREERKRQEEKAYQAAVTARKAREDATARLEAALPAVVRETLQMREPVYHAGQVTVALTINDEPWELRVYGNSSWSVYAPDGRHGNWSEDDLLDGLVADVAAYRQRKVEAGIAARERADQERQQAQEHAAIEREIADAKATAAAKLWQWPEDVALVLFKWTWQRGRDEDGSGDYDDAWSAEEDLDPNGWLPLADGRVIRLIPAVHMPIVERRAFLATEELPYGLREQVTLSVPGVTTYTFYDEASDEHHQWYRRDEYATLRLTIGHRPVKWVRARLADDTEPGSAPQPEPEPEPVGADLPTLTNPAFDLPF